MKNTHKFLIWFFIFILANCQKEKEEIKNSLSSTNWIFVSIYKNDTNVDEKVPSEFREMTLDFTDTNILYATSVCNAINGKYYLSSNDSLKIDDLITTCIYCGDGNPHIWDELYYYGLRNATNYSLIDNTLTIKTSINLDLIFKLKN